MSGRPLAAAARREVGRTRRTDPLTALAAAVGIGFLLLPFVGLLARAPWSRLPQLIASPTVGEALRLSLGCAAGATVASVLFGVPVAWWLSHSSARVVPLVRAAVTLPLVLPPVVGGVALLLVLGRSGLVGQWLYVWLGVSLPFTPAAVVVAETFVAMPFLVITLDGAFRGRSGAHEEAAATLGMPPRVIFRQVTLPLVAPSLAAGAALAFARALGEFGATITFAGSFPGRTETVPLAVYHLMETDPPAAVALALVLLLVCLAVLLALRGSWRPTPTSLDR